METLIPAFHWHDVMVVPWTTELGLYGWVVLMGFLSGLACGWIGVYLMLRRMALVGDAISHSVLLGIVVGFILTQSRNTWVMFGGALVAAVLTAVVIQFIHSKTRVKQDAAIGITFSSFFALGVLLIAAFADKVDLDQDCVLHGEIVLVSAVPRVEWLGMEWAPPAVMRMGGVAVVVVVLVLLFYKELLVSSFDPGLTASVGIRPGWVHYGLMAMLAVVVVSAFEAAGAVLVIAMLILPGATLRLLTDRLPWMLAGSVVHAGLSAVLGMHLSLWLRCSAAAAMVVMGGLLFTLAWIFSPTQGLLRLAWIRLRRREALEVPELPATR